MPTPSELCQLARDFDGQLPVGGAMFELKHNGFRCLWLRGLDGQPRLWSRNGMPIGGCDHIARHLALLEQAAGMELFVDGELVVDGSLAATKAWIEKGWRQGGNAGVFHAFDVLEHDAWRSGGTDTPLFERKAMLQRLEIEAAARASDQWEWPPGGRGRAEAPPVAIVEDGWAFDPADVLAEASRVWAAGLEGLMIKDPEAGYWRGRNASWRKVKDRTAWLSAA